MLLLGLLVVLYGTLAVTDAGGRRLPNRHALDGPAPQPAATLTGEGESEGTRFGYSVAISADGSTALVGARTDIGEVWVFTRSGETWQQQGPPLPLPEAAASHEGCEVGECGFGRSLALSADGNIALVGAPNDSHDRGVAWVFTRSDGTWTQQGELTGSGEEEGHARFGRSVALSADGSTALIGAGADDVSRGAVWVFTRSGETWSQQGAKLTGGAEEEGEGRFGRSVALSAAGDSALIGAPDDAGDRGAVWVFTRSGETWSQQGAKLTGGAEESGEAHFGTSVALSAFGNEALVGAPADEGGDGAVWALARSGETWSQQGAKLTGNAEGDDGGFGSSVALSASGEAALVGAPREQVGVGAAYPFDRLGAVWTAQEPQPSVDAPLRDHFATAVALSASGATTLIGGPAAAAHAGAAWVFANGSAPAPTVTSVTPKSGPEAGGTPVTITGSGFLPGASVRIGEVAGAVDVISETELTAITPKHAPGPEEVVVADAGGVSTGGPQFTFEAPPAAPQTPPSQQSSTTSSSASSGSGGVGNSDAVVSVLAAVSAGVPAPQFGVSGNLTPVSGKVYVKLPGAKGFVLLKGITQVPFGTIVNAIHGKVKVTTIAKNGHTQSITFYSGEFKLTQKRSGLVVAALYGGSFAVCPTGRERAHLASISSNHASGKHTVRKLWSEGHGSYSTKGNYASGAVLGTRWLTEDRCEGTLIFVATDRVEVTNLVTHHHRTVRAGHSYLAKAP